MIPLVSIIEPQSSKTDKVQRRLFDDVNEHDMYSEAIKYITDLTMELGRSTITLDLEEEETEWTCMYI